MTTNVLLSQTQCTNVVKVQMAQMNSELNPKTIADDDTLEDDGIDDKKLLRTLKMRITKTIVIKELMDADVFFESLIFGTSSTVFQAGKQVFRAQALSLKGD